MITIHTQAKASGHKLGAIRDGGGHRVLRATRAAVDRAHPIDAEDPVPIEPMLSPDGWAHQPARALCQLAGLAMNLPRLMEPARANPLGCSGTASGQEKAAEDGNEGGLTRRPTDRACSPSGVEPRGERPGRLRPSTGCTRNCEPPPDSLEAVTADSRILEIAIRDRRGVSVRRPRGAEDAENRATAGRKGNEGGWSERIVKG